MSLLTFAGVTSTVMQALDVAPVKTASLCPMGMPDMPGMDTSGASDKGDKAAADKSGGAQKSGMAICAFCAAAAHVPLQSVAIPIPAPTSVAWNVPPPVSDHSPRGPPLIQPKARGPPTSPQSV